MGCLAYLTGALFATWCVSEVIVSFISLSNRSTDVSQGSDRLSYFVVWLSTVPPIVFALLIRLHRIFTGEFGSFSTLSAPLGYLGCVFIAIGVVTRLVAVATLKGQFAERVTVGEKHVIVDAGIYRTIRHPAYLGHLVSMLGFGLATGNWVGLSTLVVLPLPAVLYRIQVEERALLRHFGPAYQEYASRTKRLLPGIY